MIADIHFCQVAGVSPVTNRYPVFADADARDAFVSANTLHTAEKVKCTRNMNQTVPVPYFSTYDSVNVAVIDGTWYYIVSAEDRTLKGEQVVFVLDYIPPTNLLLSTTQMTGDWERLPVQGSWNRILQQPIVSDALKVQDKSLFNIMLGRCSDTVGGNTEQWNNHYFWVEITTSCALKGGVKKIGDTEYAYYVDMTAQTPEPIADQSTLMKYGFFISYYDGTNDKDTSVPVGLFYPMLSKQEWDDGTTTEVIRTIPYYPSLAEVISDIDSVCGIPIEYVKDVSVSAWCPYQTVIGSVSFEDQGSLHVRASPQLLNAEDEYVRPFIIRKGKHKVVDDQGVGYMEDRYFAIYELGQEGAMYTPLDEWGTHEVTLTPLQYTQGRVELQDAHGAVISVIPPEYFSYDTVRGIYVLSYRTRVVSDSTGIYTQVDIGSAVPYIITVPHGKLPTLGDRWESYRVLDMAYDREAMENSIRTAQNEMIVGELENVTTTLISATATGAAAGSVVPGVGTAVGAAAGFGATVANLAVGAFATGIRGTIEADAKRKEQELAERRTRNQPGTGFNMSYGISYVRDAIEIGAGFVILTPPSLTEAKYQQYARTHGFASEGLVSSTVSDIGEGYYRGQLLGMTGMAYGPKFVALQSMFLNGLVLDLV